VLRHSLPWPAEDDTPSMPRVALEAVIEAPWGPIRVTTTHLEYYSGAQRAAQVARLRELNAEAQTHARARPSAR
jgi:endonuclease/exonuclease/phosphatase family metal-dependent hydrolase